MNRYCAIAACIAFPHPRIFSFSIKLIFPLTIITMNPIDPIFIIIARTPNEKFNNCTVFIIANCNFHKDDVRRFLRLCIVDSIIEINDVIMILRKQKVTIYTMTAVAREALDDIQGDAPINKARALFDEHLSSTNVECATVLGIRNSVTWFHTDRNRVFDEYHISPPLPMCIRKVNSVRCDEDGLKNKYI